MKLQEQGYKPTAGCMPMLVNFLVMFGVIGVVYRAAAHLRHRRRCHAAAQARP